jgi:tetratricopeptide (TPR) repeat protein
MLARPDAAPSGVLSGFLTPALQQRVERFELTPLGTADAEVLLRELIAEQPGVPPERITAALAQAEGNPYFLTELSRFLTEDSDGGALPDTVRAVVTARADRLAPDLKKLLRSAATIGRTFADDLLARLERDDSVESRLEQLVATGLIEPIPPDRHRFVHALTREAIYEGIPIADRTRLHAEVATVLSAREQDSDLPAVAYHLAQAEDWEAAASALVNAGEQAARLAADDDALEMYRAAIAAHEHLPTDRWGPLERSRIDRRVAETLVRLGRHEEARKQLIGALARLGLAFPDGTGAVKRATLRHLAPRLLGPSPLPPADTTPEPIDAELCQELVLLVWISYFRDHDDLALATFMLANRAARAGCLDGFAEGTCMSAAAFASLGKEKLARAYMRRAAEAVDRMTDEIEVARVTRSLSLIPTALGDFEEVRVWTERGTDLGAAAGDLRSRGAASALLGLALFMHGEFGRARALGDAIVRDATEGGERPIQAMGFAVTSLCHGLEPEVAARAAEAAQAGIEVALTVPDHLLHTLCQGNLARAQLRLGDLDAASASIDAGLRERSKRGFRGPISFFPVLAEAELALLDLARGRTRATVAANRRAIRRSLRLAPYARWHAVYAETTSGGCAWILGKKRVAERAFARADALADRYDWPGALADASLWVVRCCEEAGMETPHSLSFALTHTQSTSRV